MQVDNSAGQYFCQGYSITRLGCSHSPANAVTPGRAGEAPIDAIDEETLVHKPDKKPFTTRQHLYWVLK